MLRVNSEGLSRQTTCLGVAKSIGGTYQYSLNAGGPLPRDFACSECRALLRCYVLPCRSIRPRQTTRLKVANSSALLTL